MATYAVTVDTPALTTDLSDCLNLHGYLTDVRLWNWDVAQVIADSERIGKLTLGHLQMLEYVRHYFKCYSKWPFPVRMKKDLGINPKRFFHTDPEIIFKVAGLPEPVAGKPWDGKSLRDCNCL
ncbi:MAG: hypothetical protein HOC20_02110 [Chloroflexi bacterium]|nr:hypothetical protein [Chloroflexota bacterium]